MNSILMTWWMAALGGLRRWGVGAWQALAGGLLMAALMLGATTVSAQTLRSQTSAGSSTYTVPNGVNYVKVTLSGGGGGGGGGDQSTYSGQGGLGAQIVATIKVSPSDVINYTVGGGGSGGVGQTTCGVSRAAGGTGAGAGGAGGLPTCVAFSGAGGGGGGGSVLSIGGTVLLQAGGGGGGGGGTLYTTSNGASDGVNAGGSISSTSACGTSSSPDGGTGKTTSNNSRGGGGGGGGGGYGGGYGGIGGSTGPNPPDWADAGGGGAGGSCYNAASANPIIGTPTISTLSRTGTNGYRAYQGNGVAGGSGSILIEAVASGTYWDGANGNASAVDGGSGTWNTTNTNWTTATGSPNGLWAGGANIANFGVSGGTVTVNGQQRIGGLNFTASPYTLTGSGSLDLAQDATFTMPSSGTTTLNVPITGGYSINTAGMGTLALGGSNTYSGGTTITAGTLQLVGSGSLSSGNYLGSVANNGILKYSSSTNQTFSGVISGTGSLVKDTSSSSTLTLTSYNTYSGGTNLNAGTISLTGAGLNGCASSPVQSMLGTGAVNVAANTTLSLSVSSPFGCPQNDPTLANSVPQLNLNGTITIDASNYAAHLPLVVMNGGTIASTGTPTAYLQGFGTYNFDTGVQVTGDSTLSAGYVVNRLAGGVPFTISPGKTLTVSGYFGNGNAAGVTNTGFSLAGGGTMLFSGPENSAPGPITVSNGKLQVGDGGANGGIGSFDGVTLSTPSGNLSFKRNDTYTFGKPIMGTGNVSQDGSGTTTLTSTSNTYSGTTTVSNGTLAVGANSALSSASAITVKSGGKLNLGTFTQTLNAALTVDTGGSLVLSAGSNLTLTSGSGNVTSSVAAIDSSSTGTITVGVGATLNLTANISAPNLNIVMAGGTLNLGGKTHSFGTLTQTAGSTIDFSGAGQLTVANIGSTFTGTLTAAGWTSSNGHFYAAAVNGTPARNTLGIAPLNQVQLGTTGDATLTYWASGSPGELLAGAAAGSYTYWDTRADLSGIDGGTGTWDGTLKNWTTSTGAPNGTWFAGGLATFQGTAGAVTVSTAQSISGLTFNVDGYTLSGSSLTGNAASNPITVTTAGHTATIGNVLSGTNAFTKEGAGTLSLTGVNTFTGGLTVNQGVLNSNGQVSDLAGAVTVKSGATLSFSSPSSFYQYNGAWSVAGTLSYSAASGAKALNQKGTLSLANSAIINVTGVSPLSATGDARLVLQGTTTGSGQLNLATYGDVSLEYGANTTSAVSIDATSRLQIYAGTMAIGSLTGTGTVVAASTTTASLSVGNDNNNSTFSGVMSNTTARGTTQSWGLIKAGTGTFTLTGANTNAGATTISAGTLQIGGAGTLGWNGTNGAYAGAITNNASFKYSSTANQTLSGAITGTGSLTKDTGTSSTLTLSSTGNTYSGGTTVSAGTLALGANGALPAAGAVSVSGGVLDLGTFSQTLNGVLTVNGGTLKLGTGSNLTLTSGSGNVTSSIGAIDSSSTGTITVGTGATLNLTAAISAPNLNIVMAGGTLKLNGYAHSLGTLTQTAASTIDFGGGSSKLTVATLGNLGTAGTLLTAKNWTAGTTNFYATNVTGSPAPARNTLGLAPLNQVQLGTSGDSTLTYWASGTPGELLAGAAAGSYTYWDTNASSSTIDGGDGTWDGTLTNWTTSSGTPNGTWLAGGVATFQGTAGTVTIKDGYNASIGGLTFGTAGYTITPNGTSGTGTLALAQNATITTPSTGTVTVSAPITGAYSITKQGAGTLTLTGSNKFTGGTNVNAGILTLSMDTSAADCKPSALGTGVLNIEANATVFASAWNHQLGCFYNNNYYVASVSAAGTYIIDAMTTQQFPPVTLRGGVLATSGTLGGAGSSLGTYFLAGDIAVTESSTISAVNVANMKTNGVTYTIGAGKKLSVTGYFGKPAGTSFPDTGFTLSGGGTMEFSGPSNTAVGAITVSNGKLQVGNGGTGGDIGSHASVTLSSGTAILSFNRSDTYGFGKKITGSGTVSQDGSGTTTLSATTNDYSGGTTINAGTLAVGAINALPQAGAINALPQAGAVTVNAGGKLNVGTFSQTLNGVLTVNASGSLVVGTGGNLTLSNSSSTVTSNVAAIDSSSTGTITVGVGATLNLTAAINAPNLNIVMAGGTLKLNGNAVSIGTLTQTAASTIDFAGGSSKLTVATLGSLGSASTVLNASNWTAGTTHVYVNAVTSGAAQNQIGLAPMNQVQLGANLPTATYWASGTQPELLPMTTGTYTYWDTNATNSTVDGGSGNWDGSTLNWTTSSGTPRGTWAGGTETAYFNGSAGSVTLANSYAANIGGLNFGTYGYTINANAGGLLMLTKDATITINSSRGQAVAINAPIQGNFGITVTGGGTLQMSSPNNSYAGGTTLSDAGIDLVGPSITCSSSSTSTPLGKGTLSIGSNSGIWLGTDNQLGCPASAGTGVTGVVIQSGGGVNTTAAASTEMPALTLNGGSLLSLNTVSGTGITNGVYRMSGDVQVTADSAISAVNVNNVKAGGTTYNVLSGTRLTIGSTGYFGYGTGPGQADTGFILSGGGTMVFSGASNTATGPIQVTNGTLQVGDSGSTGDIASHASVSLGTSGTLSFKRSNAYTFATAIGGSGKLSQDGGGTTTLSGANTYTGTTSVNSGTLLVTGSTASTSAVTVAAGATLGGSGTVAGPVNVLGFLSPGLGAGTVGTLNTGALTLGNTGTLTLDLGTPGTTGGTANDYVNVTGNVNLGGNLVINKLTGFSTTGTYTLLSYSGTRSGTFASTNLSAIGYQGVIQYDDANKKVLLVAMPRLRITQVSNGGTGTFSFVMTGLDTASVSLTTQTAGTGVTSATFNGTVGTAVKIDQTIPSGWPATPGSISCVDANGASTGNGSGALGTVSGVEVNLPGPTLVAGADITCTFTNTRNGIAGVVFNDGGAPSSGANTGTPNDGLQNGAEAGVGGLTVNLTNCAGTTYASTTTDGNGAYGLSIPTAQIGQAVCVQPVLAANTLATGANSAGTVLPDGSATTVGGVGYTYTRASQQASFTAPASGTVTLNFGQVPASTLSPTTSSQQTQRGGRALHPHTFTAGTGGTLKLQLGTATATPSTVTGWSEMVYLDANCSGKLDLTAQQLAPAAATLTVVQGQQVCVLVHELVPATAADGNSNTVPVTATLTFTNAAPSLSASYTATDTTTVSNSALQLTKEVRNVTQGVTTFGTNNQAKSGEVLEYRITYTNTAPSPISSLVINDATPTYTSFVNAKTDTTPSGLTACMKVTPANVAPAPVVGCDVAQTVGGTGPLSWTFTGTLNGGGTGAVLYQVKVD